MQIVQGTSINVAWVRSVLIGDGTNWPTRLDGDSIQQVGGVYIPSTALYEYPTLTKLRLTMVDGTTINIELQKVTNQATWNTGTEAGLNAAISDIQTWAS